MLDDGMWIPLVRAVTQRQQLRFIDSNESLHFDTENSFSGNPCLRGIFNMESQLHSCTAKPKDVIFHLLQVVAPHYSSHLKNHVVIH